MFNKPNAWQECLHDRLAYHTGASGTEGSETLSPLPQPENPRNEGHKLLKRMVGDHGLEPWTR